MQYKAQNFDHILGTPGFSDESLKTHFGLYEGYVKNTNTLLELKESLEPGTPEYNEVKRRFGWEWNGMRLHEYYFPGLTKDPQGIDESSELSKKIVGTFGSYEKWEEDFKKTGAIRGVGWAILAYDEKTDALLNIWTEEHASGHLAGTKPLVVMDVFEHAFMIDYGTARGEYIDAFMKAIDWEETQGRL